MTHHTFGMTPSWIRRLWRWSCPTWRTSSSTSSQRHKCTRRWATTTGAPRMTCHHTLIHSMMLSLTCGSPGWTLKPTPPSGKVMQYLRWPKKVFDTVDHMTAVWNAFTVLHMIASSVQELQKVCLLQTPLFTTYHSDLYFDHLFSILMDDLPDIIKLWDILTRALSYTHKWYIARNQDVNGYSPFSTIGSFGQYEYWLTDCLLACLIIRLLNSVSEWVGYRPNDWSINQLIDRLIEWLTDWLSEWAIAWLSDQSIDLSINFINLLIDWARLVFMLWG